MPFDAKSGLATRFKKGNPGGPGRPRQAHIVRRFEQAALDAGYTLDEAVAHCLCRALRGRAHDRKFLFRVVGSEKLAAVLTAVLEAERIHRQKAAVPAEIQEARKRAATPTTAPHEAQVPQAMPEHADDARRRPARPRPAVIVTDAESFESVEAQNYDALIDRENAYRAARGYPPLRTRGQ